MSAMSPSYFFDLSKFLHRSIFDQSPYVWSVLSTISSYLNTCSLGKIEVEIPKSVHLVNPELISIGKGTQVEPGACLIGPCVIGENCSIRHGAYLRGNVLTGNSCVLGHNSEFKNAILFNGACAAHSAYVGDSILGHRVNLGAGSVLANLRFDHEHIVLSLDGKQVETGLYKFGAILGDDAQTGCNSVTNPGTLMGKHVLCYPCTNAGGFIPSGKIIRPAAHT
ncbi:MAG: UDP-N-acetylglucosamine diphosphorylase [Waddliaceae bacterium]